MKKLFCCSLFLTCLSYSQTTPKFAASVLSTLYGVSNTEIAVTGDSITAGLPNLESQSWAANLQVTSSIPTSMGLSVFGFGTNAYNNLNDPRWTLGTGCSITGDAGYALSAQYCPQGSGAITFTPGTGTFDSFRVQYTALQGLGSFTVQATGGAPTTVNTGIGGGATPFVTVFAGVAGVNNSVTISNFTGGDSIIIAVEPLLSTSVGIHVGNLASVGTASGQWVSGGSFGPLAAMQAFAPALCINANGVNDAGNSVPVATFIANTQEYITNCELTGDVVLMTPWPSEVEPYKTFEAAYYQPLLNLAAQNNIPVIDVYGHFGQMYQANLSADSLHPNVLGQQALAAFINPILTLLAQPTQTNVTVPNVVGTSQNAASNALVSASLTVGAVTTASSSTVSAGNVISESPVAGTSVAIGSPVSLVVSTGPVQSTSQIYCPVINQTYTVPGIYTLNFACTLTIQ